MRCGRRGVFSAHSHVQAHAGGQGTQGQSPRPLRRLYNGQSKHRKKRRQPPEKVHHRRRQDPPPPHERHVRHAPEGAFQRHQKGAHRRAAPLPRRVKRKARRRTRTGAPFIILRNTAYRAEIFSIILYGIYSNARIHALDTQHRMLSDHTFTTKAAAVYPHLRLTEEYSSLSRLFTRSREFIPPYQRWTGAVVRILPHGLLPLIEYGRKRIKVGIPPVPVPRHAMLVIVRHFIPV